LAASIGGSERNAELLATITRQARELGVSNAAIAPT
jgi:hypothetical protein